MILESFAIFLSKVFFFTSFVNNANGFPKPLSREEEFEVIKKFKAGDKEAKKLLINHNLRLVAHIVKKYSTAGEADDLISVGTIGLIKAINSYELDKGTQLSTYAARCIENEILMYIRVTKKHNSVYSLEECLGKDKDGNEISLSDIIPNEDQNVDIDVEKIIVNEKLQKIIKDNLTEREYKIICMRYGLNNSPSMTQLEVAKILGISRSYISRIENKAILQIRDIVTQNDLFID